MREIKFRAWDKFTKKMIIVHDLRFKPPGFDNSGLGFIHGTHEKGGSSGPIDDFELMQYTGLTDKNGKEIYEGDIVKSHDENFSKKSDILAIKYAIDGFVVYKPSCCNICRDSYGCICPVGEASKLEIIGNIYENPELINKK